MEVKEQGLNSGQETARLVYEYLMLTRGKGRFIWSRIKEKKTWPLKFEKLEEIHDKIHNGEKRPIAYEIDKHAPMWGINIMGLLKYLGCLDA
jgi:hypothetical protein